MFRNTVFSILICILAVSTGCGKTRFPDAEIKPVKSFSLGSAKFTPFKERPTAQELYDATCKLYDSFGSVVASYEVESKSYHSWTEENGKLKDFKPDVNKWHEDLRIKKPGKYLRKSDTTVEVGNGGSALAYYPTKNLYSTNPLGYFIAGDQVREILMLSKNGSDKLTLLPDSVVNGTDVYLLKIHSPGEEMEDGTVHPSFTRVFYLGKQDLLPRRMRWIFEPSKREKKIGLPNSERLTEFSGFRANVPISDDTFPTKPPKGAKSVESLGNNAVIDLTK
jgi:hypothetical protein